MIEVPGRVAVRSKIVNLEEGMPTVAQALLRLERGLSLARQERAGLVKLIHGYGSHGRGGVLRQGLRRVFSEYQRDGDILGFASGEEFSIFHPVSLEMITAAPELSHDPDLERSNPGVSFLWIQ